MIRFRLLKLGGIIGVICGITLFVTSICSAASYPTSTATPLATDLSMNQYKLNDAGDIITKGPWVDARAYNGGGLNDTTIRTAITDIGAAKKTLLIAPGTWTMSNSFTVPSNVSLRFEQGAVLSVPSGIGITINGPIDAPLSQIFSGAGLIVDGVIISSENVKEVYPQWFGLSTSASASVNDDAMKAAFKSHKVISCETPGTYNISQPIAFVVSYQHFKINNGVTFSYSGTDWAIKLSGVSYCKLSGSGAISCTSSSGKGILFEGTTSNHCMYNQIEFGVLAGYGRGVAPDTTNGTIGIKFSNLVLSTYMTYFNTIRGVRVAGFNTCVLFDAPDSTPTGGGANNRCYDLIFDDDWYGYRIRSFNNTISGGFANSAADSIYIYLTNTTTRNQITGIGGEPGGSTSLPYKIDSGSDANYIEGQLSNFPLDGVDNGTSNYVEIGRELYKGEQITGDSLTENTKYRIGGVRMLNTNAAVVILKYRSRNTTLGHYTSGQAVLYLYAQGGADCKIMSHQCMEETASPSTSRTRFAGLVRSGYYVYFVFEVKNNASGTTNTSIGIDVEAVGPAEFLKTGPTVETGALYVTAPANVDNYFAGNFVISAGSTPILKHLSAAATWDPASISNGAAAATTITVTGAALGDTVVATFDQIGTYNMVITGHVQAADTVRVVLNNHNGGAVNLGSGTVRADVWKH